jgi:hypothetical protein
MIPVLVPSHVQGYLAHKQSTPLGPYSRTMPRALWKHYGGVLFLMNHDAHLLQKCVSVFPCHVHSHRSVLQVSC